MHDPGIKSRYTGAAVLIFFHIAVLFIGFSILAIVFDFPVVLRESSQYRLTLYSANQSLIQPALWLLAVAGLTQIAISVILYRYLRNHSKILQKIAVPFGVLAGLLLAISFLAWAVWLAVIAVYLLKTDPATGEGPLYGWRSFSWSACLYLLLILPNVLG